MRQADPSIDVWLDEAEWRDSLADAARRSLFCDPPYLDPVWFYDDRGSALFDEITRLPEYYLTRAERSLLVANAERIAACGLDTLVELGSGTSDKTTVLLDAMSSRGCLSRYVPFDVSEATLRHAVESLGVRYPHLEVRGVVGDFHRHLGMIPDGGRRMVAFLGSTVGNLDPVARRRFFFDLDCALGHGDRLLLGIDLVKDPERLLAAYDDPAGVTAEFNRNALRVVNDSLGTDFEPEAFEHVALWSDEHRWIEMRVRAAEAQVVTVPGAAKALRIAAGGEIRTEISSKFTVDAMTEELWVGGFVVEEAWSTDDGDYALLMARPYC